MMRSLMMKKEKLIMINKYKSAKKKILILPTSITPKKLIR